MPAPVSALIGPTTAANLDECEYGMGRAYAIPMANSPCGPGSIFLGAAENGPASWAGYRTVRAGPYNTVKFSRNTISANRRS